jgi:beta-fructofuranosidase
MNLNNRWTLEQRYRRLEQITQQDVDKMKSSRECDSGFPSYHIAPNYGLLNDPNGLCYFNGAHHIFYQWTPVGPVHGMKYWYHLSTKDFVNFTDHGVALQPDKEYDSHGVYSGGAWVENDKAMLFFTGNKRDENWHRTSTLCFATMSAEGAIQKHGVIIENEYYSEHFRDPKVWKKDDNYFLVVGAQTLQQQGSMVLYQSKDLTTWQHKGPIKTKLTDLGYMWECPDFFELDGMSVMLFSPQGLSSNNPYDFKNIYSVTYILGEQLNLDTMELEHHQKIQQPDYGFDFYAPQSYLDGDGRRILIAWIGLPEIDTPSVQHQWAGVLSLPRELSLREGFLIQTPLAELKNLRKSEIVFSKSHELDSTSCLIQLEVGSEAFELELSNPKGDRVIFAASEHEFTFDRSEMTHLYAEEFGCVRKAPRLDKQQIIEIYLDNSVIEIFINGGKHTMTSRFFIDDLNMVALNGLDHARLFPLKRINGLNYND